MKTVILMLVGFLAAEARGADWPQWLGPKRDASSTESVEPWTSAPPVVWQRRVGEGHSSPVVAGGKVYLLAKVRDREAEVLTAFEAASGKEAWKYEYERAAFHSMFGDGPRSTPALADGKVYSMGATGIVNCVDALTGKPVWHVKTAEAFGSPPLFFGASCSPVVHDGLVLLNVGGKGTSLVALDAASGSVKWKALDDGASYSSPIVIGVNGPQCAVFLTPKGVVGVEPTSGKRLWQYPLADLLGEASATPVEAHGMIVASTITLGTVALRLPDKTGGECEAAWKNPDLTSYFSTPIQGGAQLYMVTGTKPPALHVEASLHCVDLASGKALWTKSNVGKYHASLLCTGNGKLILLGDTGRMSLIEPSAEGYRELATAKVSGETWAHPALAGGRLFIRDAERLICFQMAK